MRERAAFVLHSFLLYLRVHELLVTDMKLLNRKCTILTWHIICIQADLTDSRATHCYRLRANKHTIFSELISSMISWMISSRFELDFLPSLVSYFQFEILRGLPLTSHSIRVLKQNSFLELYRHSLSLILRSKHFRVFSGFDAYVPLEYITSDLMLSRNLAAAVRSEFRKRNFKA